MRFLSILLLLVVLLSCSTVNKEEDIATVTAKSGLNMCEKPNISSKVILILPYGAKAEILDHLGDFEKIGNVAARWKKIIYKGKKGWVYSRYFLNKKIRAEIVHISSRKPKRLINIDISKATKIRRIAFYNANKTNIPAYREPSYKAQIKDYLKPLHLVDIEMIFKKNDTWYYSPSGWMLKKMLKLFPVKKINNQVTRFLPKDKFYHISELQRKKLIKASGDEKYGDPIFSILKRVAYLKITHVTSSVDMSSISLLKGFDYHDSMVAMDGEIRSVKNKNNKVEITCLGNKYSKFIYAEALKDVSLRKDSTWKFYTIQIEIIDKKTIKYDGKIYRKLK